VILIFLTLGIIYQYKTILHIFRKNNIDKFNPRLCILLLYLCSPSLVLIRRPTIYELPISCFYFFCTLLIYILLLNEKLQRKYLIFISISSGLLMCTKPSAFVLIIFIYIYTIYKHKLRTVDYIYFFYQLHLLEFFRQVIIILDLIQFSNSE